MDGYTERLAQESAWTARKPLNRTVFKPEVGVAQCQSTVTTRCCIQNIEQPQLKILVLLAENGVAPAGLTGACPPITLPLLRYNDVATVRRERTLLRLPGY